MARLMHTMHWFKDLLQRKLWHRRVRQHMGMLKWGGVGLFSLLVVLLTIVVIARMPKEELVFKRDPSGLYDYKAELPLTRMTTSLKAEQQGAKIEVARGDSRLEIMQPLTATKLATNKGQAVYTDASKNVELRYTLVYNGLKEDIVLHKRPSENVFASAIKLSNLTAQMNSDGIPVFTDKEGSYQFHFEKPYAIDAHGNRTNAVRYHLIPAKDASKSAEIIAAKKERSETKLFGMEKEVFADEQYVLMTEVDKEWLADPGRAFPITIDPTVVHDTTAEFSAGVFNRVKDVGSGTNPKLETYYQETVADEYTVGLWHLNETANDSCAGSADVCDSSGEGNHGVETGTTITTTDQFLGAAARDFDGTNDFVQITTGTELNITLAQPFTIEAWAKADSVASERVIVNKQRNTSNELLYDLQINSLGIPTFILGKQNVGSTSVSAANAMVVGNWYHLAGVSDGTNIYLYVNGELANQTVITSTVANATQSLADIYFGELYDGTLRWDGLIDEVRLSNVARSAEQIKLAAQRRPSSVFTSDVVDFGAVINSWSDLTWDERGVQTGDGETASSSASLAAQWKFNEPSGTTAVNTGGTCGGTESDCNLTLTNFSLTSGRDIGVLSGWTSNNRKWGTGALMLDGTDDYAACTDANCGGTSKLDFTASDSFTMEMWFKSTPYTTANTRVLMSKRNSSAITNAGYTLFLNTSDLLFCRIGDGTNTALINAPKPYTDSQWHHTVCVIDRTAQTMTLYVDGKAEATPVDISGVTGSQDNAEELRVGALSNTPSPFLGTVDVARIYRRALPLHEILSNYNAASLDLQTRVGSDTTPNDGSGWEDWKPTASETVIDALDNNTATGSASNVYRAMNEVAPYNFAVDHTMVKYNNTAAEPSSLTGTDGRIPLGTAGSGDDVQADFPSVIKENGIYKMWYGGNDGTSDRMYYATSPDGLTWTKYNNTTPAASSTTGTDGRLPLGAAATGDDLHAGRASVIKDGDTYKMWYSGHDGTNWRIYMATSPDGLTWTKVNNAVPSASNTTGTDGRIPLGASGGDTNGTIDPTVIKDGDTYKMWYGGLDATGNWRIYHATSPDGLTWTKYNNTANAASNGPTNSDGRLGLGGAGAADALHILMPRVIKDGDFYKIWYGGFDAGGAPRTQMAISYDGLQWQKIENTAATATNYFGTAGRIPLGEAGSGDDAQTYGATPLKEDGKYRFWYTGYDGANYRIYSAEAAQLPVSISRETVIKQEGSASVEMKTGAWETQARTEGLWHLEETSGTGAWVDDAASAEVETINAGDGADGAVFINSSVSLNADTIAAGRSYADGIAYKIDPATATTSGTMVKLYDTINGLAAGDEVLLINLRGASADITDVGNYEFLTIDSINASTKEITFTSAITRSYDGVTATSQRVVIQRVPNYTNITVCGGNTGGGCTAAGTLTASAWDGYTTQPTGTAGYRTGIVAFRASGTVNVNSGGSITASSLGYRGGTGFNVGSSVTGGAGESRTGTAGSQNAANDGGGGGGSVVWGSTNIAGGGGGGYGASGTAGSQGAPASTVGAAGGSYGEATVSQLFLGSGGGGTNGGVQVGRTQTGGIGGGITYIAAGTVTVAGTVTANGAVGATCAGSPGDCGGAGGGSGGSVYVAAGTTTLGSSLVTSTGGTGGVKSGGGGNGGAGAVGRIRVVSTNAPSGTTSPAASMVEDGDLTPSGSGVTSTVGVVGRALNFNGTDYLSCSDAKCGGTNKLDPSNGQWSAAAWVKTTTTSRQTILGKGSTSGSIAYSLETGRSSNGGIPEFLLYNTIDGAYIVATGNRPIVDGNWHHVVGTYDGTTASIYVDGVLAGSSTSKSGTQVTDSSDSFTIGARSGNAPWTGSIDEPTVARMTFTYDQVAEMYRMGRNHAINMSFTTPLKLADKKRLPFYIAADRPGTYLSATLGESGLANYLSYKNTNDSEGKNSRAFWHFEETSGTSPYVRNSGGTMQADMSLTPTNGVATASGKIGMGRFFDGTNDYLTCTDANCGGLSRLDIGTSNWSVGAWVNTTKVPSQNVISKGTATTQFQYQLQIVNGGSPRFNLFNTGDTLYMEASASARVNDGKWHHLVGTYDGNAIKLYIDGVLHMTSTSTSGSKQTDSSSDFQIGARTDSGTLYFKGYIDEPFVLGEALGQEEVRQLAEYPDRTQEITIDFGAVLDSGNLITGSGDTSFTVDGTVYGLAAKGSNLYLGDKIIIKENVDGTEYLAQGTVNAVTVSTGAVTVASWDSGSTFPSGGFTASAGVFKWQREYFDLTGALDDHLRDVEKLTFRITSGNEGRTIFLDDIKSSGDYLSNPLGSVINSSTGYRYFQYRFIPTSWDNNVSASLVSATMGHNTKPSTPSLDSPADAATNQSLTVPLLTTTTDTDSDYLRYKIELCTNVGMTTGCHTFDQTQSQSGWSGQNTQSSTAYTSGTQATFTIPANVLAANTTYYWRSYAIDPAGSNTFSGTQTPRSFTTVPATASSTASCTLDKNEAGTSIIVQWTDVFTGESNFSVEKSTDGGGFSVLTSPAANATSTTDNVVSANHTYQYRINAVFGSQSTPFCTTSTLSIPSSGATFSFEGIQFN